MNEPLLKIRLTDGQLLERHLSGDADAFRRLVLRYQREMYNFLLRFIGDHALAEDVFQDTFLQLHLSAGGFDLSKKLKPWLFTIAANKARDALRSRRRRATLPLDASMSGDEPAEFARLIPSGIPSPADSAMNLETRQAVQNIVANMPDHLRMALLLFYFHGFTYNDIAEMLDIPLGTVKSRLHAATAVFAEKWKELNGIAKQ
ncbi:MAG: RNA polymerase sigma factor [Planctomycetes bacterium]|nr:RNA polymerase sigma factor [Planctomycetota bacterium]